MDVRMDGHITPITSGRTDAQIAEEYRRRAIELLGPVVELINEARTQHGMAIGFQIGPPDGFNRQSLAMIEINKKLA